MRGQNDDSLHSLLSPSHRLSLTTTTTVSSPRNSHLTSPPLLTSVCRTLHPPNRSSCPLPKNYSYILNLTPSPSCPIATRIGNALNLPSRRTYSSSHLRLQSAPNLPSPSLITLYRTGMITPLTPSPSLLTISRSFLSRTSPPPLLHIRDDKHHQSSSPAAHI